MCVALGLATVFKSGPDDFSSFTRGAYTTGGALLFVNGTEGDVETCGANLIANPRYGTSLSGELRRLPTEAAFVMIRDPSTECVSSSASLPLVRCAPYALTRFAPPCVARGRASGASGATGASSADRASTGCVRCVLCILRVRPPRSLCVPTHSSAPHLPLHRLHRLHWRLTYRNASIRTPCGPVCLLGR